MVEVFFYSGISLENQGFLVKIHMIGQLNLINLNISKNSLKKIWRSGNHYRVLIFSSRTLKKIQAGPKRVFAESPDCHNLDYCNFWNMLYCCNLLSNIEPTKHLFIYDQSDIVLFCSTFWVLLLCLLYAKFASIEKWSTQYEEDCINSEFFLFAYPRLGG